MPEVSKANVRGRMLVVDDDAVIATMFQRYFTSLGFAVDEATDFDQAIARTTEHPYAVVLQDLRLGRTSTGREGLDLVRHVRSRSDDTGIVVLTAYADPQTVNEARTLGADRVLQKPQPFKDLVRVIGEVLDAHQIANH